MDQVWHWLACHARQQIADGTKHGGLEDEQPERKDRESPHSNLDADLLPDKWQRVMKRFP
jgi:hypothetical protein